MVALPGLVAAADPSSAPELSSPGFAPSSRLALPRLVPRSMNLFTSSGFRFQDPNWAACTSTSVRTMLNLVAMRGSRGAGFIWRATNSGIVRDRILAWERSHDTMTGGNGSDPHGWRNALNYYGWGVAALRTGGRVYEDASYTTYDGAMKAAVRAMAMTGKPVGLLGWRGAHAQMVTGYYGLVGKPFARDATGKYTNAFSVGGFYLTDPLRSSATVNRAVTYAGLRDTTNYRLRFQRYYETDSLLDDTYTPGVTVSKLEWYGRFVLVLPVR
jgi:hypothetical protein